MPPPSGRRKGWTPVAAEEFPRATDEVARLRAFVKKVANACVAIEFEDARIDYLVVQIDKEDYKLFAEARDLI